MVIAVAMYHTTCCLALFFLPGHFQIMTVICNCSGPNALLVTSLRVNFVSSVKVANCDQFAWTVVDENSAGGI